jgi:hypothetical protein
MAQEPTGMGEGRNIFRMSFWNAANGYAGEAGCSRPFVGSASCNMARWPDARVPGFRHCVRSYSSWNGTVDRAVPSSSFLGYASCQTMV